MKHARCKSALKVSDGELQVTFTFDLICFFVNKHAMALNISVSVSQQFKALVPWSYLSEVNCDRFNPTGPG